MKRKKKEEDMVADPRRASVYGVSALRAGKLHVLKKGLTFIRIDMVVQGGNASTSNIWEAKAGLGGAQRHFVLHSKFKAVP